MEQLFTPVVNDTSEYTALHTQRARERARKFFAAVIPKLKPLLKPLTPALDTAASHTMVQSAQELEKTQNTTVDVQMADRSATRAKAAGTAVQSASAFAHTNRHCTHPTRVPRPEAQSHTNSRKPACSSGQRSHIWEQVLFYKATTATTSVDGNRQRGGQKRCL